jgi:hypothetical protein
MSQIIQGPAIVPTYEYALRVTVEGQGSQDVMFPAGCKLRAELRAFVGAPTVIAELTTENGGLTRVDDHTVEMRVGADRTASIETKHATVDFARTDPTPDVYLYVQLKIPVLLPVTLGAA